MNTLDLLIEGLAINGKVEIENSSLSEVKKRIFKSRNRYW